MSVWEVRGDTRLVALILSGLAVACTGAPSSTMTTVDTPMPTLRPPLVTPIPGLSGTLWMDRSLGEIWEIQMPDGRVQRVPVPPGIFPIQPSVPLGGSPVSFAGAAPDAGERYGIYVADHVVLPVRGDIS